MPLASTELASDRLAAGRDARRWVDRGLGVGFGGPPALAVWKSDVSNLNNTVSGAKKSIAVSRAIRLKFGLMVICTARFIARRGW